MNRIITSVCSCHRFLLPQLLLAENSVTRGLALSGERRSESCVWKRTSAKLSRDISSGLSEQVIETFLTTQLTDNDDHHQQQRRFLTLWCITATTTTQTTQKYPHPKSSTFLLLLKSTHYIKLLKRGPQTLKCFVKEELGISPSCTALKIRKKSLWEEERPNFTSAYCISTCSPTTITSRVLRSVQLNTNYLNVHFFPVASIVSG